MCHQGQASEWALLRRHSSEDLFGVQICGAYPDTVARTVDLIDSECNVDFIDINMGCPIDIVVNKGAGSSLLTKPMRMKNIIQAASGTMDKPLTVKVLVPCKLMNLKQLHSSTGGLTLSVFFRKTQNTPFHYLCDDEENILCRNRCCSSEF